MKRKNQQKRDPSILQHFWSSDNATVGNSCLFWIQFVGFVRLFHSTVVVVQLTTEFM